MKSRLCIVLARVHTGGDMVILSATTKFKQKNKLGFFPILISIELAYEILDFRIKALFPQKNIKAASKRFVS